jgi:hypothetical protein
MNWPEPRPNRLSVFVLLYFDAYAVGDHAATQLWVARYGREAGKRVVENSIPHAGYWFEEDHSR